MTLHILEKDRQSMNIYYDGKQPAQAERFLEAAEQVLQSEGLDPAFCEISVSFVDDETIRKINRETRGVDSVTDVLSFPQYEDLSEIDQKRPYLLGDVVLCTAQAERQAGEYGHSIDRELVYLFVHSMCHLVGYDHMDEDEKAEMRAAEEAVMKALSLVRE